MTYKVDGTGKITIELKPGTFMTFDSLFLFDAFLNELSAIYIEIQAANYKVGDEE